MTTPVYRTEAERQKAEDVFVATCLQCLAKGVGWPEQNYRNRFRDHHPVIRATRAEVLERAGSQLAARQSSAALYNEGAWRDWLTAFVRDWTEAAP